MWYPKPRTRKVNKEETPCPDYNLIMPIIDAMVRNRLYLKRNYNPTPNEIKQITNKAIRAIQDKYGSLELMRSKTASESLTPILQEIIRGI